MAELSLHHSLAAAKLGSIRRFLRAVVSSPFFCLVSCDCKIALIAGYKRYEKELNVLI